MDVSYNFAHRLAARCGHYIFFNIEIAANCDLHFEVL